MPTMGVDVVVRHDDGKILLTKRTDFPVWCLPGGGVEDGESVGQTATREVFEETGLQVALIHLVGIYSRPKWMNGGDHVIVFAARAIGGTLIPQESEVAEMGYFEPDRLPRELVWWQRYYIADAIQGKGGSVVKTVDVTWPFEPGLTRQQLVQMKTQDDFAAKTAFVYELPDHDAQRSELDTD